mgnify:CR=1 FL=1
MVNWNRTRDHKIAPKKLFRKDRIKECLKHSDANAKEMETIARTENYGVPWQNRRRTTLKAALVTNSRTNGDNERSQSQQQLYHLQQICSSALTMAAQKIKSPNSTINLKTW